MLLLPPMVDAAQCAATTGTVECATSCLGVKTGELIMQMCDETGLCTRFSENAAGCCTVAFGEAAGIYLCRAGNVTEAPTDADFNETSCAAECPGGQAASTSGSTATSFASRVVLSVAGAALVRLS